MANEKLSGEPKDWQEETSQPKRVPSAEPSWENIVSGVPDNNATSNPDTVKSVSPRDAENAYWDDMNRRSGGQDSFEFENAAPAFTNVLDEPGSDGDFMKDPTDFTDVALVERRKKMLKVAAIGAVTVIVIAVAGFFAVQTFIGDDGSSDPKASESVTVQDPENPIVPDEPEKPLLSAFPTAPEVTGGVVTTTTAENVVTTSSGKSLTINGTEIVGSQIECVVNNPTDFCLSARSIDGTDQEVDVYFLKDGAHSRIFENPSNFNTVEVSGASSAGVMEVSLVGGQPTPVIGLVNSDSSGFMVALPGATLDEASAFASTLSIS